MSPLRKVVAKAAGSFQRFTSSQTITSATRKSPIASITEIERLLNEVTVWALIPRG